MNLIDLFIRRPIFTWMTVLSLLVFGMLGYNRLGVDQFPDMKFPIVTVSAILEGASPEVMEEDVTDVIEEYLNTIAGVRELRPRDTLQEILDAPDGGALIDWLIRQPLLFSEPGVPYTMVHAGLPPQWDTDEAATRAREVESALAGKKRGKFLAHMYGDQPDLWDNGLSGWRRLRFITNALTRIRYVDADGRLDLDEGGAPGSQPETLVPWFASKARRSRGEAIVFGHWATLQIEQALDPTHRVFHLDTGCVWGGSLTALRLEDQRIFSVPSQQSPL